MNNKFLKGLCLLFASMLSFNGAALAQHTEQSNPLINAVPAANDPPQSFRVLCYHDVRDHLLETFNITPDSTFIETKELINHFTWLKANGYQPVSLQQIIDARAHRGTLPDKAVLLTFDDGYKSTYTTVFPLLKLFNYPAVIALVGDWMETPANQQVQYGDKLAPRNQFASWEDIRTMVDSGLVEVASHSYNLHKGIVANPQGSLLPAAVSRFYYPQNASYESDAAYLARIKSDLQRNSDLIEQKLHQRPRAMVWPYGKYNQFTIQLANQTHMPITMNLQAGPNTTSDSLSEIRRALVTYNTKLADFIQILHQPIGYTDRETPIERVIHLDLDYVYDADPQQQEKNLSSLLDRIKSLQPTTVYLQAFADADGDGVADAVYFPNRHLPMKVDLFSRVAWQLKTRAEVRVYAWMPVLAFKLPGNHPAASHLVKVAPQAPAAASINRYHRLSPFDPLVRQTIIEIYEDLGKSADFQGILFHDDATLSDYEDASPAALNYYHTHWQLPDSITAIRNSPELQQRWTQKKTEYLNAFTVTLANKLREYQPALLTARNLYAQLVLNPASEEWYAQSLPSFLNTYDFTAVMAMPYMEQAANPTTWLKQLLEKIQSTPGAMDKTVFELQSRDWRTRQPIPTKTLAKQLRQLHLKGVRNFGYYPDDFQANMPQEELIKPVISVETRLPVR